MSYFTYFSHFWSPGKATKIPHISLIYIHTYTHAYTPSPIIAAKRGLKMWNFQPRTHWFDSEPPYRVGLRIKVWLGTIQSRTFNVAYLHWGTCSKLYFYIISSKLLAKRGPLEFWCVSTVGCVFNKLSSFVGIYLPPHTHTHTFSLHRRHGMEC